jgi:cytochrome c biogenesis factor
METETISKNGVSLKKSFLFFAVFCIGMASTFAQDIITLKNGDDIRALVQEVGEVDVKYKKFDNPNGPNYTLRKSEISMIKYANGSKDVFADNATPRTSQPSVYQQQAPISFAEFSRLRNNNYALEAFLKKNDAALYRQFDDGVSFSKVGGTLMGFGIPVAGISAIVLYNNYEKGTKYKNYVSFHLVAIGSSLIITSIPLLVVGGGLKRSAANGYEEKYFYNRTSYQPSLNFQITGDGVGLALKF